VRRLPLVGFVVSAVAHVVAVMLLILVVERLTSLPGLFIDLTTEATEANGPTKPAVGSRAERKPSGTRAKRAPASSPGASRASGGDSAPARAVAPPEAPEISRPLEATTVDRVPDRAAPTNAVPSAIAPSAPVSVDTPTSASAAVSQNPEPSTETAASPGASPVGAGHSGRAEESTTTASGGLGGAGVVARPGQGLALATPGASPGGGSSGGVSPGSGGSPAEYAEYLARLRQRIQESLRYPLTARRRGLSGTVHLEVTIRPDGAIAAVTIVESSSYSALDDAALEAVRSLRPMPFPTGVPPRRLYVRVPVIFTLP